MSCITTGTTTEGVEEKIYEAEAVTIPVVSYSISASVRLNHHLGLTAQYLGLVHFAGSMGFTRIGGERFVEDIGNFNTSNLFFGLTFSL